jgi:3-isopropylmalate/(R)-2-methylmalate dehydratase large subunit
MAQPRTLYDKIIDAHAVCDLEEPGSVLLYVDRTVLNEYTSPQAFAGLRSAGRSVRRPRASLAVVDHVNPTDARRISAVDDQEASRQIDFFTGNCRESGIELFDILDPRQGIEHVIAPEQGLILPGMVVAAGDSHTTTYGALGAVGFGIGTSDIEHYLATQTLVYTRLKTMRIRVEGQLSSGVTAKDIVMSVIREIGADGAVGHAVEFDGSTIRELSVEARMTICNMIVEGGARAAVIAPDEKVFAYVNNRPRTPRGALWDAAVRSWRDLGSDATARFDRHVLIGAANIEPMVTWGTSPDQAIPIHGTVPDPADETDPTRRGTMIRALNYMGLTPGTLASQIKIDRAFIGSCTNARIEDLRDAARLLAGRSIAKGVRAMVVPGSTAVRDQAEREGLDAVFKAAGFEWRQSGCSLCLAMNNDVLAPGERCASSTNRNFEGRQGRGARTHLMSPAMVAAAAIEGHLTDARALDRRPLDESPL